MDPTNRELSRRRLLTGLGTLGIASIGPRRAFAVPGPPRTKPIPATGELLPVIGMGSWITFDVGDDAALRAERLQVLQTFFDEGGALIDSSPMYLSSQEVIGHCLARIPDKPSLFAATKVWTMSRALGVRQMEASQQLWSVDRFDLMQVHNLLDWETHLETPVE